MNYIVSLDYMRRCRKEGNDEIFDIIISIKNREE